MNQPGQFCSQCGTANLAGASFCTNCGNKLTSTQQQTVGATDSNNGYVAAPNPPDGVSQHATVVRQMDYPKASLGSRFLAHIVDGFLVGLPLMPGALLLGGRSTEGVGIFLLVVAGIWSIFYGFCKDGFAGGQSYGKKMNGLMVVNITTNEPCTKSKSFLRALGFAIPYVGGVIETIMVLATDKGRRLGDLFAGTQVIANQQYRR